MPLADPARTRIDDALDRYVAELRERYASALIRETRHMLSVRRRAYLVSVLFFPIDAAAVRNRDHREDVRGGAG